jgi:hypothetical protein
MNSEHTGRQVVDSQWLVEECSWNLIRVPGFGRYRKPTVGIGRLGKFRMANSKFRMESDASSVGNGRLKKIQEEMGYETAKVLPDEPNTRKGRFWVGLESGVEGSSGYRQLTAGEKNFWRRGRRGGSGMKRGGLGRMDMEENGLDLERKLR